MNQELYEELQAKIARALALVDEVAKVARAEDFEYVGRRASTLSTANRAVIALVDLSEALAADWGRDERELDQETGIFVVDVVSSGLRTLSAPRDPSIPDHHCGSPGCQGTAEKPCPGSPKSRR